MSDAQITSSSSSGASGGTLAASASAFMADPWSWLERRRGGEVYQPPADDAADGADDPNGCGAKLRMILESGYPFAGRSLLSLGSSAGFYEYRVARAAGLAAAHLVDVSEDALARARADFAPLALPDFRAVRSPADEFRFERTYDVCFFLSLFHHYDRLGRVFRERAVRMLGDIGQHCGALFFETGQTDDTQRGSERWPVGLEMAAYPSPAAWIEDRIPVYTGYARARRLGTNPRTNRHLYLFSHA